MLHCAGLPHGRIEKITALERNLTMKKILVINPGSTSTKIAFYHDGEQVWKESIEHDAAEIKKYTEIYDQKEMRTALVLRALADHGEKISELSGVVARGGLLPSYVDPQSGAVKTVSSGAYVVGPALIAALRERPINHHASNLGCAIAYDIAQQAGVNAYIYDPVTVDELIELVRLTGLKDVRRIGQAHNLNMRAAAMRVCREKGKDYYSSNIAVAHLGGGITLSLHSNGRIIDIVSDDEGPFSPERAGLIPDYLLMRKVDRDGLDYAGTMKLLQRQGGLTSYFGTSDSRVVEKMAEDGDREAQLVYEAMALGVARGLARLAVLVKGKVDYFVLTGGIAYSSAFCRMVEDYAGFLGEFVVVPGENEMQALADGCLRILNGEETAHIYG